MNDLIIGKNSVLEVIDNGSIQVNKIWLSNSLSDQNLKKKVISFAKEEKIPYYIVPVQKINGLAKNQNHQGIALSIAPIKYLTVTEIINHVLGKSNIVLIADGIEDAHNLGALIRTFIASGNNGVILTGRNSIGINSTIIKTSAGTALQAKFARATNCTNVINELKKNGFWIVGTDNSTSAESIYKIDYPKQIAILVGNEHEGLGQLVKKNCDFLVKIPISEKVDSLNVSVAFGIVLFEMLRQKELNTIS